MSNQDERLGSLLILSDLALIISTYGVLLAFNYFIEPINSNTWIICTFFVGIKILIVGISDITGIGRYYIVSLLFVLIADVVIFLINQLMAFSLSLRLILLMTAFDMIMVLIAIFIWKRITRHNFRPIEPEGISWDDEIESEGSSVKNQPALEMEAVGSDDVFHFDAIEPEPQVAETISEEVVEDVQPEQPKENNAFLNFNEITEELPTQEEIEKQLAYDDSMSTELSEFEEALSESQEVPEEEEAFSNLNLFTKEEPEVSEGEAFSNINLFTREESKTPVEETKEDVIFVTEEAKPEPQPAEELPPLNEIVFETNEEKTEPEASEVEVLAEDSVIVEEPVVEPVTEEVVEEAIPVQEVYEEPEEIEESEVVENVTEVKPQVEEIKEVEEEVKSVTTEEPEPEILSNESVVWGSILNEVLSKEQSEVEVLGEADTVEEVVEPKKEEEDVFSIPLFNNEVETSAEEEPVTMTTAEEIEEEPEEEEFFVESIYDYNEITNSTIGFNKRFSPIPFNVTQNQLDSLTTDVKLEMIRFNSNLSKLIDAYNESLPSNKSYQKINDLITLMDQDSISDADRIIRNKIDLLNQKGFISDNLIHNFIEIINKLNNRVYSIEIAQENLNEKQRLEKEREAEKQRQQRLWEQNRTPSRSPYSRQQYTVEPEPKKAEEPVLNDSEVLLRNDDMDIIIDSADLELLKEFMAQQEKND